MFGWFRFSANTPYKSSGSQTGQIEEKITLHLEQIARGNSVFVPAVVVD